VKTWPTFHTHLAIAAVVHAPFLFPDTNSQLRKYLTVKKKVKLFSIGTEEKIVCIFILSVNKLSEQ